MCRAGGQHVAQFRDRLPQVRLKRRAAKLPHQPLREVKGEQLALAHLKQRQAIRRLRVVVAPSNAVERDRSVVLVARELKVAANRPGIDLEVLRQRLVGWPFPRSQRLVDQIGRAHV